jgi:molybdopterin molybdotransferase
MQEDTQAGASEKSIQILDSVKPWEGVRFRGEDVKREAILVRAGERLSAAHIALLAAAGIQSVAVGQRSRVGLLATGNELREPGSVLKPGEIYESNRAALVPLIQSAGAETVVYPIVPDDQQRTRQALEKAFSECDIVVTCGGVSVGEMDFVKAAFEALGGNLDFWKVAIKPGRPFVLGRLNGKFLFGLPGNCVSAFVTFLLLARPALLRWQGISNVDLPSSPGVLEEPLANDGRRRHFMRVKFDSHGKVNSAGTQASHILSSLAAANGLVDVPPDTTLEAGKVVKVLRWE